MKFTKEEISLCKQIAERHKKKIGYGDWYVNYDSKVRIKTFSGKGYREEESMLLWTISDCLEFLGEKFERLRFCDDGKVEVQIWLSDGFYYHIGKTPLEACLKAVLAVIKEVKK